jgi:D-glycero-D-manno-heptose 1,7-bisphosphate phosphatase
MRAIFVDRDGVICENRCDHVKSWEEFRFLPNVLSSLKRLSKTDFAIVLITNQAIINRGIVAADAVNKIHARMLRDVRRAGGRIDRIMVCPHRDDERCGCRKPEPGLVLKAAAQLGIDLRQSYLIGDAVTDIQAGMACGLKNYMVLTGRGLKQSETAMRDTRLNFQFAHDLQHAVDMILNPNSVPAPYVAPVHTHAVSESYWRPALQGHAS